MQCHLCGEWFRFLGSSHLRRTHGWTLAEYREAFRLPVMLATCSREHSQRLSAHAHSEIERANGFGEGVGVPVARRGPVRVPRWRSLAAFPELVRELHPQRNAELDDLAAVAAKSSRRLWWRCAACGHDWQATVGSRAAGAGCPACDNERKRGPRTVPRERSLHALHPELVAEWHPTRNGELDAAHLSPASKHRAWWSCAACGHQWQAAVHNRARGSGCPVCGLERRARTQSQVEPARSLAIKYPDVAAELHPERNPGIDPMQLGARSSLKLWWQLRELRARMAGGRAQPRRGGAAARSAASNGGPERKATSSPCARSRSSIRTSPPSCTPSATPESTPSASAPAQASSSGGSARAAGTNGGPPSQRAPMARAAPPAPGPSAEAA